MGTAIAYNVQIDNLMSYRWEHFPVGFPIFGNIFIPKLCDEITYVSQLNDIF